MTEGTATVVRRIALGASGLGLLLIGGFVALATGPWHPPLPGGWPSRGALGALLDPVAPTALRVRNWWPPVVVGCAMTAAAPALVGARRLWSRRRSASFPLGAPEARLRVRALHEAVAARVLAVDGVADCRVRASDRRRRILVRARVSLHPGTAPADVLPPLAALTAHVERALEPHSVHVRFRLRTRRRPTLRSGRV
ncbi:hypothetical protein ACFW2Y_27030 [Streptomyces sp. NPDC058877]|uniref:hypothetical protein n=1 Tax=Streptomyces sp. NPDC058877 TaxID=3346665 RepID=UPI0036CD0117